MKRSPDQSTYRNLNDIFWRSQMPFSIRRDVPHERWHFSKTLTWHHNYRMFTYIYSLLIEKGICDQRNIQVSLCTFVWRSLHFLVNFLFLLVFTFKHLMINGKYLLCSELAPWLSESTHSTKAGGLWFTLCSWNNHSQFNYKVPNCEIDKKGPRNYIIVSLGGLVLPSYQRVHIQPKLEVCGLHSVPEITTTSLITKYLTAK